MRKTLISEPITESPGDSDERWIDIGEIAEAEVTSEARDFPLEAALTPGPGWRAGTSGIQTIRLIFQEPRPLKRIRLSFSEADCDRTQEFVLRWAPKVDSPFREIVRQQWNFSPHGSTREVEDYSVELPQVAVLELTIRPDISSAGGIARLDQWRLK
jgi:hypothetical protein